MRLLSSLRPGPGVGPTVAIGEELGLQVNAQAAGKGKVSCVVVQPDGSEVEAEVVENEDGTFDIFYTAPAPGSYVIYVRFGGENIPRSPFKVMVSLLLLVLVQLLGLEVWSGASQVSELFGSWGENKGPMCPPSVLCSQCFYPLSQQNRRPCAIMPGSNPAGWRPTGIDLPLADR